MTDDWLKQAQTVIADVMLGFRPEILAAHGNIDEELKGDNSPVTVLDKKLEQQLREALAQFDASIPIVGEEFGGEMQDSGALWLIDPIDGTESFIRGIPFVHNMVSLVIDNEPIFTMIYRPISDEMLVATKGKGAYRDGERIHSSTRPMHRLWIDIATSQYNHTNLLAQLKHKVRGVKQINEFTFAAEGRTDALLNGKGGGLWDNAARGLLLQEAGAKVRNIGSDTYDYRNGDFLAAHPDVFDELMEIITNSLTDTTQ